MVKHLHHVAQGILRRKGCNILRWAGGDQEQDTVNVNLQEVCPFFSLHHREERTRLLGTKRRAVMELFEREEPADVAEQAVI